MRNKKKLLIKQLDEKLKIFQKVELVSVPEKGWINTVRVALNMTLAQLGKKLEITRQGAKSIEESEQKGTLSINSLREVGRVLGLKFVYGYVPQDGSLENLVKLKAEKLAEKIVFRTNQNMQLENQGIGDEKIKESIKELAEEISREMRKSLWD